jgi:glycosyltransferase involved in cell wall biosynthesis
MSESVKNDFEKFAPEYAHKARVLKTVTPIPETVYEADFNKILKLYNLPEKFVYLPNQFWKHKNHKLVFNALKILKDRGIQVSLVCTGFPGDYRHAGYFAGLFQKLSEWGIRNQVIYLGMIPYEHVLLLMRQCVCVLNPSLFEGFGLSVDEARSIGKQTLLSDIPAHREQNPPKAVFFNPYDAEGLAGKINEVWNATKPGPDIELEFESHKSLSDRIRKSADSFLSIVKEVVI